MDEHIASLQGPIVVFGAGGFLGANLIRRLLDSRSDCFAVTHQKRTPWRLLDIPSEKIIRADVTDPLAMRELVQRYRFKTYFFLAAYGGYARQNDPQMIYQTNLIGLNNVLYAAKEWGLSSFVHAGSSSEYGSNCRGPSEGEKLDPNSHYSISKVAASHLIHYMGKMHSLPVLNLRYYSIYGPWEESDRLIPRLVSTGLKGKFPPLADPDTTRDFVYVGDAVEATILAASVGVERLPGGSVNIATGIKTTLRDIVTACGEELGVSEEPSWGAMPNRSWDTREWFGNPSLATDVLGWKAQTDLRTGLRKTAQWIKARPAQPHVVPEIDRQFPIRLSAVIACYKDAEAIPLMHERLTKVFQKLRVDYEIVFVNDCSPDGSAKVLSQICNSDPHVLAIEHTRNFGSQSAFVSGMELANGHAVILMDGDLQDPPELIESFYRKWREGFEVVYGRRVKREAHPLLQLCYKAFYRTFRRLAYVPIPVDAGDFSLIDRRVVEQLKQLPETDQFLRGLRAWVGFRQTGVDYVRPERAFGKSTNNWRKNFWWARKAIFNFSFVPLEAMLYSGFFLTAFAMGGLLWQIAYRWFHPEIPHGQSTIIVLVLLFGGANILALSILGEYLSGIFEESKRRPKYIRRLVQKGKMVLSDRQARKYFKEQCSDPLPGLTPQES